MSFIELTYSIGKLAGVLGLVTLVLLVFSGDMARFFDRYFGLDKIIKFQRKFSLLVGLIVLFHPLFFIISNQNLLNFIIPDLTLFPFAMGIVAFYIFWLVILASKFYKMISYAAWQYIHGLIYIMVLMVLYHAVYWGSDGNNPLFQTLYALLLLLLIIGFLYRTTYKIRKLLNGKCHVKEVQWLNDDTFKLGVKCDKKFTFKGGQFCFLRIKKRGLHARHPFTIASSPSANDLEFIIKNTGRFTDAASKLKPGEEISLDGPFGMFTLGEDDHSSKNLVFIAGGVGITPFMSLVSDLHENKKDKNTLLIYGTRTEKDLAGRETFDIIPDSWFEKVYVLSQEEVDKKGFESGRIDKKILEKYIKDFTDTKFYICGPEPLKKAVIEILKAKGVKNKSIKIEDFFW